MDMDMEMKKKNRTGLVLGIIAAVIVLAAAAAAVFFAGRAFGRKPELKLKLGFANMASEVAQYGSSLSEKIDFGAIKELKKTGTMHTNADISVTVTGDETTNVSFDIDSLRNESAKKASYDIGIGMYGFKIPFAEAAITSDTLYVSLPPLLKDTYRVGLTKLGEEFNNSEWAELLDTQLPDDYAVDFFKQSGNNKEASNELLEIFHKSGASIKENMVIQNLKEKKDGCAGVRVTVPKDASNRCMEEYRENIFASDFYEMYIDGLMERAGSADEGERLKDLSDEFIEGITAMRLRTDYVLDFYFDKKGRIVNISTPKDMETEDGILIAVDISFTGEERVLDTIEGGIYAKNGDEITYLGVERSAKVSETSYSEDVKLLYQTDNHDKDMTFSYVNDFGKEALSFDMELYVKASDGELRFTADGEFADIVKGEGFTFRLNNASLASDGEEKCYLSAVVELAPSDKEPEIPSDGVDLLQMSTAEIQKMAGEALGSIRKFGYE